MIINRVELTNIGPYNGEHKIDLTVTNEKNIILIGGKNGSGKTTFLKAIKIGLFGSYAFGYKTESSTYFKQIKELLNTASTSESRIKIEFLLHESLSDNIVVIDRIWQRSKNEIEESLNIHYNQSQLNDFDKIEFFEKFKSKYTPQIIESMIYDGEHIGQLIDSDNIQEYIESSFNSLYGITLMEQLKSDLGSYMRNNASKDSASKEELMILTITSEINSIKSIIKNNEKDLLLLKEKYHITSNIKKSLDKKILDLGGLSNKEKKNLAEKISIIQKEKESLNKRIKNFIENEAVFALNIKLLTCAKKRIENELPITYLEKIVEIEKRYTELNFDDQKKILSKMSKNTPIIHRFDENLLVDLEEKIIMLKKSYSQFKKDLKTLVSKNSNDFVSHDTSGYNDVLASLIEDQDSNINIISLIENQIKNLQLKLDQYKSKLKQLINQRDLIETKLRSLEIKDNSFLLGVNAIKISDEFITFLKNKKLQEVSKTAMEIFKKTQRKDLIFNKLSIDEKFSISLQDYSGEELSINVLSAGEKQILISSIIWSLFKNAKKDDLFIFDTPLSRLDYDNRTTFIEHIVKNIGKQVLILSTDSEFVNKHYKLIKDNTNQKYEIYFDEVKKTSRFKNQYFGDNSYV